MVNHRQTKDHYFMIPVDYNTFKQMAPSTYITDILKFYTIV